MLLNALVDHGIQHDGIGNQSFSGGYKSRGNRVVGTPGLLMRALGRTNEGSAFRGTSWCSLSSVPSLSEQDFHITADETLERLQDAVEGALEDGYEGDFEVDLSQGVLNIVVRDHGTWVINKQAPNRQVWWSSPISGPMRFELDQCEGKWVNTRDPSIRLLELLQGEVRVKCGVEVDLIDVLESKTSPR
ncbi:unnamed protein product [Choristocarpus tenellus]